MSNVIVNQRAQNVLKILIERYIQDGNPIGSKTIADEYALGLSSATIRNILADLEEAGYLASPHASAGRIPTAQGYRLFVNSLLTVKSFNKEDVLALQSKLDSEATLSHIIESASSLLSDLTKMAGVVTLPKRNKIELRQIEFAPLSTNRVLVILVLNNCEVQNRIIHTDRVYSLSELQQVANYLNSHYLGKDLLGIRKDLSAALRSERNDMTAILQAAVEVANKAFVDNRKDNKNYVIAGQNNLLHYSQQSDLERLKLLFESINQKQEILNLLDHALEAEGMQIFIGKESGYEAFGDCSIIATSYSVDGQLVGSLGVIGPTRMPYDRIISAVDVTAKLLSAALNQA